VLVDQVVAGGEKRHAFDVIERAETPFTLADNMLRAVAGGEIADDACDGADRVQVAARGLVPGGIALQDEADLAPGNTTVLRTGRMISTSSGIKVAFATSPPAVSPAVMSRLESPLLPMSALVLAVVGSTAPGARYQVP
jgi:hypothetical protein